jgi:hypothetical protein
VSFHRHQRPLRDGIPHAQLEPVLEQRCLAENLYWSICRRVQKLAGELDYFPEELEGLDALLSDTYFCNFSLFQSMPDSWAIKQLFPIMPIHRLDERPSQYAVLGDITCDSDGKVDAFIDRRDVKKTLQLHSFDGKRRTEKLEASIVRMFFQPMPMFFGKLHALPVVIPGRVLPAKLHSPGFVHRRFRSRNMSLKLDGVGTRVGNGIDKSMSQA